jgi:hypothetical protein
MQWFFFVLLLLQTSPLIWIATALDEWLVFKPFPKEQKEQPGTQAAILEPGGPSDCGSSP